MIRAAWFCAQHCGVAMPDARGSWRRASPPFDPPDEALQLIGRPVKYFSRMPAEARFCLCAAGLALQAAGWRDGRAGEIGLLAAGFAGCRQADHVYFRDYLAAGRTMARGNLFIYTLPTSAASAVALTLALTGPTLHLHDDANPLAALHRHARQMLADHEAGALLALWSDSTAAICLALDATDDAPSFLDLTTHPTPTHLAQSFRQSIPQ